jgi:hypothetical protein
VFDTRVVPMDQVSRLVRSELRRVADHRPLLLPGTGKTATFIAWLADDLRFCETPLKALPVVAGPRQECPPSHDTWPDLEYAARFDMSTVAPAFYDLAPAGAGRHRFVRITARDAVRRLFDRAMTFADRYLLLASAHSDVERQTSTPGHVAAVRPRGPDRFAIRSEPLAFASS